MTGSGVPGSPSSIASTKKLFSAERGIKPKACICRQIGKRPSGIDDEHGGDQELGLTLAE
jgi:hypothetical protein